MKILVIEDDAGVARLIRSILVVEGFAVDHAETGAQGIARALATPYDGIVLDLGLGDLHGVRVLQDIRRGGVTTPVLVLTAEAGESSIVQALDAGADEYLVKPARNRELAARVRALVRRRDKMPEPEELAVGSLSLNRLTRNAQVRGQTLNLSPREFALLGYLIRFVGIVVTRPDLLEHVWGMDFDPGSNVVDVTVKRLRHKLAQANAPVRIEAHRGAGFALVPAPDTDSRSS